MFLVSYDGSYLGRNIFVPNFVPQVEKKTVTYHCRSSNEKVLALPPCTEFRKIQNTHKMVGNPIGILYYFFPLFFFCLSKLYLRLLVQFPVNLLSFWSENKVM